SRDQTEGGRFRRWKIWAGRVRIKHHDIPTLDGGGQVEVFQWDIGNEDGGSWVGAADNEFGGVWGLGEGVKDHCDHVVVRVRHRAFPFLVRTPRGGRDVGHRILRVSHYAQVVQTRIKPVAPSCWLRATLCEEMHFL